MELLLILASMLFGFGIGYVFRYVVTKNDRVGILHVDISDPDGPYLFLESSVTPDTIMRKEYVTFKVAIKTYLSQK